jgi:hypothetical protein
MKKAARVLAESSNVVSGGPRTTAVMKRNWTLDELAQLLRLFPETYTGAVLRCVRAARGQGRFLREGHRQAFCDVSLQAWPADSFSVTCAYDWPDEVGAPEAEDLDRALLQGLVEGAGQLELPPWRSTIVCTNVVYKAGFTNPAAVRVAASLAVQDLVAHGEWVVDGSPPEDVA